MTILLRLSEKIYIFQAVSFITQTVNKGQNYVIK